MNTKEIATDLKTNVNMRVKAFVGYVFCANTDLVWLSWFLFQELWIKTT